MHRRLLLGSIALIALLPCIGPATTPAQAVQGEVANFFVAPDGKITRITQNSTVTDTDIFSNEDPSNNFNSIAQQGRMWAEDIHRRRFRTPTGFGVGFFGAPADSFDVTMGLFAWTSRRGVSGAAHYRPMDVSNPL